MPATHKAATEQALDDMWNSQDHEGILLAAFTHIRKLYSRDNELAATVTMELERHLDWYAGPLAKLTPYDPSKLKLSHYCNLLASSRAKDAKRKTRRLQVHEVLAGDLVPNIEDLQQVEPDGKDTTVLLEFVATLEGVQRAVIEQGLANGIVDESKRHVLRSAVKKAETFGATPRPLEPVALGVHCGCHSCNPARATIGLKDLPPRRKRPAGELFSIRTQKYHSK